MTGQMQKEFEKNDSTDFAYSLEDIARFRVNVFRHLGGMGCVMRAIPSVGQDARGTEHAAGCHPDVPSQPGHDPRHRQDRLRENRRPWPP